jgi:hypothetical protein
VLEDDVESNYISHSVYFVVITVEYSQKPHYTRVLPGVVYDSWKIIQFKSPDINSLDAEFRKSAIQQVLDSYKTPELNRALALGDQNVKEQIENLSNLMQQNTQVSYSDFWISLGNDYWNSIIDELYNDMMTYQRIVIIMPAQQGSVYAGFSIRQTIKYIRGIKPYVKIISKGADIVQKINEDNVDSTLIILVGFSAKLLNINPTAKIYVVDQTLTDPNILSHSNFKVISSYNDLLRYYKTYIPIGILAYRVIYNIWKRANNDIPDDLKVICGFSVLSDGLPRDIESKIIVDEAVHTIRNYYDNFGSGNVYAPLRWLIDLGLALRINMGSITPEKIIYKILPVLAIPIRLPSEWYNLSLAVLVNMDNPNVKAAIVKDLIDMFVVYVAANERLFNSIIAETYKDPNTGQDITVIDPEISYYISLIEGDIIHRASNLDKPHLQNHYKAINKIISSITQSTSQNKTLFLFNSSTSIPAHANKKRDRNTSKGVPIDSTNLSFARVVYAILKIVYAIRKEYARYIKSKYINSSYTNYDHKTLISYITNPSSSNNVLLTREKIGVYVITNEVVRMDISTSLAAELSRITFKPVVLIANNDPMYEIVISDISHKIVLKVLESILHVAPALQKLPVLNVILSNNQVRITTPKTSAEGIHVLISQLDNAIRNAAQDEEHPYVRIIPLNKRIAYAPVKNEEQLEKIRNILQEVHQIQNEENNFFFNIDKSIIRLSLFRDVATGKLISNCKIFVPKNPTASYFVELLQDRAKTVLRTTLIANFESKVVISDIDRKAVKTLTQQVNKDELEFLVSELVSVDSVADFLDKIGGRGTKANHSLSNYFWTLSGEFTDVLANAITHSPEFSRIQNTYMNLYPNGIDQNGNKVSMYPIIVIGKPIVNFYAETNESTMKMTVQDLINTGGTSLKVTPIVSKINLPILFIPSM